MNIIFLDIDGVLCNHEQWNVKVHGRNKVTELHHFEFAAVQLLNEFATKNNAKVVISSTWRTVGLELLRKHFILEGCTVDIIDETPFLTEGRDEAFMRGADMETWHYKPVQRGDEIKDWLDRHPEVKSFVVFDDNSDMDAVKKNFVWTLTSVDTEEMVREGLTAVHIAKAQAILDKSNKA